MVRSHALKKSKDITIVVNKEKFVFNKNILCRESEYFGTMFNGSFAESRKKEVEIKDIEIEEFRFFSYWMKANRKSFLGVRDDFLLRMLVFADRFLVQKLRHQCYANIRWCIQNLDNMEHFCYKLQETAIMIDDPIARLIFAHWFESAELKSPRKWCIPALKRATDSLEKFKTIKLVYLNAILSEQAIAEIEGLMQLQAVIIADRTVELHQKGRELMVRIQYLNMLQQDDFESVMEYVREAEHISEEFRMLRGV